MANRHGHQTYTYLFYWKDADKAYYGYRSANKVSPTDDLWKCYKGTSKVVDRFVIDHGEPDIVMIDQLFESTAAAKSAERDMIEQFAMDTSDHWLNKSPAHKNFFHGKEHTEETKRKMSEAKKGKAPNNKGKRGYKQTPESIAKRVASLTGKKRSDEAKANLREGKAKEKLKPGYAEERSERAKKAWETKRARGYDGSNKGRVFSAEARANMSAGQKNRKPRTKYQ